jgi:mRNA interferase RelE/StbE
MRPKGCWVYKVRYRKQVIKFLQKQDKNLVKKIVDSFEKLKLDPHDHQGMDIKPLQGYPGTYRLRVSKFRILFSVDDTIEVIDVTKAKSRGDIYK